MIRVVVADDHHLVRQGICALLDEADDLQVVGQAEDGQQAVELVQALQPEIVVMDISMPRLDGTQATERILALDLPTEVVILSMHADQHLAEQMLRAGAKGYLLKASIVEELLLAVRSASQGKVFLSPAISEPVLTALMNPGELGEVKEMGDLLTPREREVLQLIAEGYTNSAIAEELTISVKTVEKHRSNLMGKLDVHDLASLMRVAIKHQLIFLQD
ncbi:MAG: response regulator transcription factor [Candidatus Promineifilaceae bacterium]|nr:response regulator transcription factor [Candidatus Promineifilaceae bacterium]